MIIHNLRASAVVLVAFAFALSLPARGGFEPTAPETPAQPADETRETGHYEFQKRWKQNADGTYTWYWVRILKDAGSEGG